MSKHRTLFGLLIASALSVLVACTSPPTADSNASFNTNVFRAETGVQAVQTGATALLRAKAITVAQDQLIQKQVDLVHQGLVLAKSFQSGVKCAPVAASAPAGAPCVPLPPDPAAAQKQLDASTAILNDLKKQTGVTSP